MEAILPYKTYLRIQNMERGNQFWGESYVKGRELGCPNPSANLVGVPSVVSRTSLDIALFFEPKINAKIDH